MKKFFVLFFSSVCIFCSLFLFSCSKKEDLSKHVSYLRQIEYNGQGENFKIRCFYGFKETPFINDGQQKEKVYGLTFRLLDKELDQTTYSVNLDFNNEQYQKDFAFDQVNHCLSAFIEVDNFAENSFPVTIKGGSLAEKIDLISIVPEKTLSYASALDKLNQSNPSLINAYRNEEGEFIGEIHMRIIVKKEKPYWYIGLINQDGTTKALLVDGFSGEVLAIRKIA